MKKQLIPIFLTFITFFVLVFLLHGFILFLNSVPTKEKIIPLLRIEDILVGLTIYLKTSVDFAIFIGNLMKKHTGTKNRIAIEIGTALGNGIGTSFVLLVWTFFKEVPLLMAFMIFIASLVLLKMAQESLEEFLQQTPFPFLIPLQLGLRKINTVTHPFLRFLFPQSATKKALTTSFFSLLFFSFSIPFILGLDDFAGYIPLFSIINVFGFATGVFLGHMLLNVSLFASPKITVALIEKPIILIFGSLAFIGIALWGFFEIIKLLFITF